MLHNTLNSNDAEREIERDEREDRREVDVNVVGDQKRNNDNDNDNGDDDGRDDEKQDARYKRLDINLCNTNQNINPLFIALDQHWIKIVARLLEDERIDVVKHVTTERIRPIQRACGINEPQIVKLLWNTGQYNDNDIQNCSLLHYVFQQTANGIITPENAKALGINFNEYSKKLYELTQFILSLPIYSNNINDICNEMISGQTAFTAAIISNQLKCVNLLLNHKNKKNGALIIDPFKHEIDLFHSPVILSMLTKNDPSFQMLNKLIDLPQFDPNFQYLNPNGKPNANAIAAAAGVGVDGGGLVTSKMTLLQVLTRPGICEQLRKPRNPPGMPNFNINNNIPGGLIKFPTAYDDFLKKFFNKFGDILTDFTDFDGVNTLLYAVLQGQNEIIKFILDNDEKFELFSMFRDCHTLVHFCCHPQTDVKLLEKYCQLLCDNCNNLSEAQILRALSGCIQVNNIQFCKVLLNSFKNLIDINTPMQFSRSKSPLLLYPWWFDKFGMNAIKLLYQVFGDNCQWLKVQTSKGLLCAKMF